MTIVALSLQKQIFALAHLGFANPQDITNETISTRIQSLSRLLKLIQMSKSIVNPASGAIYIHLPHKKKDKAHLGKCSDLLMKISLAYERTRGGVWEPPVRGLGYSILYEIGQLALAGMKIRAGFASFASNFGNTDLKNGSNRSYQHFFSISEEDFKAQFPDRPLKLNHNLILKQLELYLGTGKVVLPPPTPEELAEQARQNRNQAYSDSYNVAYA